MSAKAASRSDADDGQESYVAESYLDSATFPDNVSIQDPKYSFLNELLQQREQDLLAAADIGEMLLEKNRSLTQKVVELQRELEEQKRHSIRADGSSDGEAMSSGGVEEDDDDDDSSEDDLNSDGSVILTNRRARVSMLHETQMTQRRTSFKGQALREAAERQKQLERVMKETEHADEIIDSLLTDGLLLSTLLHWRKLVDKHTVQRSHKQIIELQDKVEESEHKIIAAATSAKEASAAAQHRVAEVEAEVTSIVATKKAAEEAAKGAKETIEKLTDDIYRSQTIKMQEKEDYEKQISVLLKQVHEATLLNDTLSSNSVNLRKEFEKTQELATNLHTELETCKSLLQRVQNDNDELKEDLQELRSENLVLKGRMEDTKIDFETRVLHVNAAKDKELEEVQVLLQQTQGERQQIKQALQEAKEMLAQVEAEHQLKINALETEKKEAKAALQKEMVTLRARTEDEVQKLTIQVSKFDQALQDLTLKTTLELKSAENEKQAASATLQQEIASLRESKEDEVQTLTRQLAKMQVELKIHSEDLADKQSCLTDALSCQCQLEDKLNSAQKTCEGKEREIQKISTQLETLQKELLSAQEAMKAEHKIGAKMKVLIEQKLRAFGQDMQRSIVAMNERTYKCERSVADVEVELARYSTDVRSTHHFELAALERNLTAQLVAANSQAQIAQQKLSMDVMRKEEDLKAQVQILTSSLAQKDELLQAVREETTSALSKSEVVWQETLNTKQRSLDELKSQNDRKTATIKSIEMDNTKMTDMIKCLEAEKDSMAATVKSWEAEHNKKMGVIKSLEGTLRETQRSLTDTENTHKEMLDILKKEHEAVLSKSDAVWQETLNTKQRSLDELKSQNDRKTATIKSIEMDNTKMTDMIKCLEAEKDSMAATVKSWEAEHNKKMGVIKSLEGTLRETQRSLTDTENTHKEMLDILKKEHEAVLSKSDAVWQETLNTKQRSLDELKSQNDRKTATIKSIEMDNTKMTDMIKCLEAEKDSMAATVKSWEAEHNKKMGVIKSLEGTLRETQRSLTDTENKLKEEHEAAVQQTADADAVTQEALANMVLLEDELTQRKEENNSLRMELMSTQDGLIALRDLKESAISQLVTRCDTFETDLSLVTGEQNATLQEQSLLRKSMQESYVQTQREKHELTDQLKLMQDRIKRLRLEAEENERNLKIELQERATENKLLITSLETQKNMNSTLDEGNRRVQDSLRSQLSRLRSDLDSSRFLDSSLLEDTAHPESPDKIAAKQKSELVRARQVELTINCARHLPKVDLMGTCDAYCEIEWQGEKHKTTVKKNSYSPDWNETFAFSFDDILADVSDLSVVVMDWDMMKKADVVGKVVIPADNLQAFLQQKQNVTQEVAYPVLNKGKTVTGNDKQPCVINLKMCLLVPNEEPLPTVSAPSHVDGRGDRNKENKIATSPHNRSILSKSLEGGKQDEQEQLLDDFESEIERIKTAILTAETLNAQLIAKVANLDGTLLEQTALNQTLLEKVTRAHENAGKIRELEESSKIIEGENANLKDMMAQLKVKLENIERKTQEELNKYKDAISYFHHALENGISEQAALRKSFEEELLRINKIKDDAEQRSKILESVNARHEDTIKKFEDDMARVIKIKADEVEQARQKAHEDRVQLEETLKIFEHGVETLTARCAVLESQLQEKTTILNIKDTVLNEKELEFETKLSEIFRLKSEIEIRLSEKISAAADLALAHSRQVEELQRKHAQELETSETAAQELDRKFKQALRDGTLLERQIHEMTKGSSPGQMISPELPQLQELQERFDKYRQLSALQAEEANNKIKSLERQLDDYISEVGILTRKADEEMRVREIERQDAVRREAQAAKAAADLHFQSLKHISSTAALKKQADLHKMETDELYCQMIVLRKNHEQVLNELVALQMQNTTQGFTGGAGTRPQDGSEEVVGASQDACKESSVEILRRKMHEKLGKARAQEAQAIREELQRMTSMANITRMKLMANVYNQEAASIAPRTIAT